MWIGVIGGGMKFLGGRGVVNLGFLVLSLVGGNVDGGGILFLCGFFFFCCEFFWFRVGFKMDDF